MSEHKDNDTTEAKDNTTNITSEAKLRLAEHIKREKFRRLTLPIAAITAVIIICFIVWKVYAGVTAATEKQILDHKQQIAESVAFQISKKVAVIIEQVTELATKEETISVFATGDKSLLARTAADQLTTFEYATALDYIQPRAYILDDGLIAKLSLSSIALLRAAESRTDIRLQAQLSKTKDQLDIALVAPVRDKQNKLVGLLHFIFDKALFNELLKGINTNAGYVELVQIIPQRGNTVLATGGDNKLKQTQDVLETIRGTQWAVSYWPSSLISTQTILSPKVLIFIALLLGIGIVSFFLIREVVKKLMHDEDAVIDDDEEQHEQAAPVITTSSQPSESLSNQPAAEAVASLAQEPADEPASEAANEPADELASEAVNELADEPATEAANELADEPATEAANELAKKQHKVAPAATTIDSIIFRSYDIRGVVGETLSEDIVYKIACAIGNKAADLGQKTIVVGRDARNTSAALSSALVKGLQDTGRDVIDIGMVPTPLLYFATHHLETNSGVMVTGSHNPPEYNGLKIVLDGNTLSGDKIKELETLAAAAPVENSSGAGSYTENLDIATDYIRRISEDIQVSLGFALNIVIDCGNGVAGRLAPQIFKALGHNVAELYCDIDGNFPNHHPDPSQPDNLQALIDKVKSEKADIGIAFDGDGDRLGLVDSTGNIIWPDQQLMLLAQSVLSKNQGAAVIFDVKCSHHLKTVIEENGGKALMWKTGHSLIKNKMKEVDALLAGEMSGHIFLKDRWYGFDDAFYAAARLIEIFTNKGNIGEVLATLPVSLTTPELRLPLPEAEHSEFMAALTEKLSAGKENIIDIDGIRIEYDDGWGLVRSSNTSPCITLRFEGDDTSAIERIKAEFREAIQSVKADAELPF